LAVTAHENLSQVHRTLFPGAAAVKARRA
jgi:hypothetical protein